MLEPPLEEVVVEYSEEELQVQTVFPKGNVNGREPLVPALQGCVLQSLLPELLLRLLPSEDFDTGIDWTKTDGTAVDVENKLPTPKVERETRARSVDKVVSLLKQDG